MRVILDAMGGDNAPGAIIEGAVAAAKGYGVEIVLVGDETKILAAAKEKHVWSTGDQKIAR